MLSYVVLIQIYILASLQLGHSLVANRGNSVSTLLPAPLRRRNYFAS